MGHDQLFKDILRALLREFLQLFFPETEQRLDFGTVSFLDKELFTDLPDGRRREADLVARMETREGSPELILVHIELQAKAERQFGERMLDYYMMLRLRHRLPILPIAVFLQGRGKALSQEEHRILLFGQERLRFRYESLRLAPLRAEEYLEKKHPLASALAALMRRGQLDVDRLKGKILQRIGESDLDGAVKFLLVNLAETYLPLSGARQKRFERLLQQPEYQEAREMEVTWADRIREEGREEGLVEGKRQTLLRLLSAKFGPLPEEIVARVKLLEASDVLDVYLDRLLSADSLSEIGLRS